MVHISGVQTISSPVPPSRWAKIHPQLTGAAPEGKADRVPGSTFESLALCALLYMAFGRITDFYLGGFHLPFITSVICLILGIANGNILAVFRSKVGMMFAALTVWLMVCVPFSVWRGGSFDVVTNTWFKSFALFVVIGSLLRNYAQCARVLVVLAFSFLTAAILAFVWGETADGRFALALGLYSGANELATAMVQGFIFWWFMTHRSTRSVSLQLLSIIPFAPIFYILAKTGSRGGFLSLGVLAVVLFFHYRAVGKVIYVVVLVTGILVSLIALPETARLRLATLFTSDIRVSAGDTDSAAQVEMTLGSSEQRLQLLLKSLELTLRNPLFGVGPGQFMVAEDQDSKVSNGKRGTWLGTHNTYTQISSEAGIPGLIFFAGSMFFCWRELSAMERLCKNKESVQQKELKLMAYTLRLALISYAAFFCVEHIGYDPFYPALAGVISALSRITRERVEAGKFMQRGSLTAG